MASPPPPAQPPITTLLRQLAATPIDFILVGGLAAVAQGAPLTTFDIDIVHRRDEDNVDALMVFLSSVDARYRRPAGAPDLGPSRSALLGAGHNLFTTNLGPLDVLGAIEGGRGYHELLKNAVEIEIGGGSVRVLELQTLAELKRGSPHPKDQLSLRILEATLRRLGR